MAVTPREAAIIALYEDGAGASEIARELGLSAAYVEARIRYLCFGLGQDRAHSLAMKAGSAALAAAIARARTA